MLRGLKGVARLQSSDGANPPHPRGWVMRLQLDLEPLPCPQILSRPEEEPPASSVPHMVAHMYLHTCKIVPTTEQLGALSWCHTTASHSPPLPHASGETKWRRQVTSAKAPLHIGVAQRSLRTTQCLEHDAPGQKQNLQKSSA